MTIPSLFIYYPIIMIYECITWLSLVLIYRNYIMLYLSIDNVIHDINNTSHNMVQLVYYNSWILYVLTSSFGHTNLLSHGTQINIMKREPSGRRTNSIYFIWVASDYLLQKSMKLSLHTNLSTFYNNKWNCIIFQTPLTVVGVRVPLIDPSDPWYGCLDETRKTRAS